MEWGLIKAKQSCLFLLPLPVAQAGELYIVSVILKAGKCFIGS